MKKTITLLSVLIVALLFGCAEKTSAQETEISNVTVITTEAPTETDTEEMQKALATILTASDFQNYDVFSYFPVFLKTISADEIAPEFALFGGDYSIPNEADPDDGIQSIRDTLTREFPGFQQSHALFIQGNHDNPSEALTPTGLYDMGAFLAYALNEDDFSSGQAYPEPVEAAVNELGSSLSNLVSAGETRPVIVMSHIPLHHSGRRDNECARFMVDTLNEYGRKLDILFLFGHNHSGAFDDYIGGSVNYIPRGGSLQVQNPGEEYTEDLEHCSEIPISFTYMNYGYVGYCMNAVADTSTNVLTVGVIRIWPEAIEIIRYTGQGVYSREIVERISLTPMEKAA